MLNSNKFIEMINFSSATLAKIARLEAGARITSYQCPAWISMKEWLRVSAKSLVLKTMKIRRNLFACI